MLGKPILDGDVLPLNPAKLGQLLPERLREDPDTGSRAIIQETYAEDFPCLLRVNRTAERKEHGANGKDGDFSIHVFPCSLYSTLLSRPSCHLMTLSALAKTFGGIA